MLTDNTLSHFQDWLYSTHRVTMSDILPMDFENSLVLNSLIIDFFDSVGIYISIHYVNFNNELESKKGFESIVTNGHLSTRFREVNTRERSIIQAIEQANKIYNLKQNSNGD